VDQATLKKITILEPSEMGKLLSILPRNQLEAKFGGSLPDLTKFWYTFLLFLSLNFQRIPRVPFSNLSPTKTTSNSNNLESSLARLSQQIESVEGKFQKILTPDHKFRSSQTPSPNIQAHSTTSPGRASGFPEPRNYPTSYSNNQAQASLQSPYEREKQLEKEKRSSFPIREYEEVPRVRTQVTPGVTEYYAETYQYQRNNEDAPKRSYQPQANGDQGEQKAPESQAESTEQSIHYDFNDDKLIDLILNENDALLTGKVEGKPAIVRTTINQTEQVTRSGNYGNDVNRQEVFKTIPRSTAGDKQKAFSEYYTQPDRRTYNASTTTSTYVTREYSTAQPNPRFVQGKTEYEIPKSSLPVEQGNPSTMRASQTTSGGQYEEWNPQKYAKKKDDEIDELEREADFCGLCVKSRKKEKTAKV